MKEATTTQPPNLLHFDHAAKRRRATSSNNGTNIQVVLSDHTILGDHAGQRQVNTDAAPPSPPPVVESDWDTDTVLVAYPDILVALSDLHGVMPAANMLQYKASLRSHGIHYVDGVEHVAPEFLVERVGMQQGVVHSFLTHVKRLVKRARKGKGQAGGLSAAACTDGENKPIVID